MSTHMRLLDLFIGLLVDLGRMKLVVCERTGIHTFRPPHCLQQVIQLFRTLASNQGHTWGKLTPFSHLLGGTLWLWERVKKCDISLRRTTKPNQTKPNLSRCNVVFACLLALWFCQQTLCPSDVNTSPAATPIMPGRRKDEIASLFFFCAPACIAVQAPPSPLIARCSGTEADARKALEPATYWLTSN